MNKSIRKYERMTGMFLIAGAIWIMYYAWDSLDLGSIHVPDAGMLPFLCGAVLALLAVIWSVMLYVTPEKAEACSPEEYLWHKPVIAVVLMVVYGWAIEAAGYITATSLFVVAWEQIIEREKWVKTLIIAVLGTAAMYTLFAIFLRVAVPQEFFLR